MSESFFSRWSRRKREAVQTEDPADGRLPSLAREDAPDRVPGDVSASAPDPLRADGHDTTARHGETASRSHPGGESVPLPTLEDVQRLTPQSDFQPFMQPGVGAEVRNAAMKKLFADPHFNVMDGLDIYIDDYNQPDPMPAGMLRKMASAQFLKLVPQEAPARQVEPDGAPQGNPTPADGIEVVAQSPDSSASADPHIDDNPHLQLQPDPAPADPQPGPGPR